MIPFPLPPYPQIQQPGRQRDVSAEGHVAGEVGWLGHVLWPFTSPDPRFLLDARHSDLGRCSFGTSGHGGSRGQYHLDRKYNINFWLLSRCWCRFSFLKVSDDLQDEWLHMVISDLKLSLYRKFVVFFFSLNKQKPYYLRDIDGV